MLKTPISFCLSALLMSLGVAQGQPLSSFDFLRLSPSAQGTALGGAFLNPVSVQSSAMFYNPALLSREVDGSLSVSWLNHLSDLQSGSIAYAQDLGTLGVAAAGLRFFHWGSIVRADRYGEELGRFGSSNIALSTGLSRVWHPRLRYGASLHAAYTSMAQFNALLVAMDAGIVYYDERQKFTAGLSAMNLGLTLSSLGQTRDRVPVDLRVSVSKRLQYIPVLVGLSLGNLQHIHQISSVNDGFRHTIFSLEFQAIQVFHVRLGYSHRKRNLKSERRLDLAGTSVGFGLHIRRFHLDYSFHSWSFAGLHQLTVTTVLPKGDS